ncbi:MAG: arsenate reductase/protein-tyrosine-phosphatase family protein [Promethearchaeota archaeon]
MPKIKNVLFICYANICRSPAAHKLAEFYAKKYNLQNVKFDSAGWHRAFPTAVQETKNYLKTKGIDLSNFKSKLITKELIENADFIIGMERYHIIKVKKKFKDLGEKIKNKAFTLKEFNGAGKKEANILDPYNKPKEEYYRIMNIVEKNVKQLVKKIKKLNLNTN